MIARSIKGKDTYLIRRPLSGPSSFLTAFHLQNLALYIFSYSTSIATMKLTTAILLTTATASVSAFSVSKPTAFNRCSTELNAKIRGPTEKAEELRFGWDGTVRPFFIVQNSNDIMLSCIIRQG